MRETKKRKSKRNILPNRSATADPAWIERGQKVNRGGVKERDETEKWTVDNPTSRVFAVTRGADA